MSTTIQLKRGLAANLASATLLAGEPAFTTDTGKLYISDGTNKVLINPDGTSFNVLTTAQIATGTDTEGKLVTAKALADWLTGETGTAAGDLVKLDANGKLDAGMIPSLALTDVFTATTEAAMLALSSAGQGDVCIRTDVNKTFILAQTPASTLANWKEILTPLGLNRTIGGDDNATGTVTDTGGNISVPVSVTITAPAASTTQATAGTHSLRTLSQRYADNIKSLFDQIALKAPLASPALTGTPTAPTAAAGTNTTQIATTAFVTAAITAAVPTGIDGGTF